MKINEKDSTKSNFDGNFDGRIIMFMACNIPNIIFDYKRTLDKLLEENPYFNK